jgi:hypothetical protein
MKEAVAMTTVQDRSDGVLRSAGITGLAGIILVHLADLPAKFAETPYMGWLYVVLMIASAGLIAALLRGSSRPVWFMTGLLASAVFAGFVLSRSIGLPGAAGEIGRWDEPLGMVSLGVEAFTMFVALLAMRGSEARHAVTA